MQVRSRLSAWARGPVRRVGAVRALVFALAILCLWAGPAEAAVELRFHSKDFGASFPHAFIILDGTLDATGERVSANYGFTVRRQIGPSVLFGPVQGEVVSEGATYVANSNTHFSLTLSDDEYRLVMALVERWRTLPQPSYRLDNRNCVSFVAEVATLLGLTAETRGLMRRPRAFLDRVRVANAASIAARSPPVNAVAASTSGARRRP